MSWKDGHIHTQRNVPVPPTYCTKCGQECSTRVEDDGIGAYEYWGATGVDTRLVQYSDCCEADVTTDAPEQEEDEE